MRYHYVYQSNKNILKLNTVAEFSTRMKAPLNDIPASFIHCCVLEKIVGNYWTFVKWTTDIANNSTALTLCQALIVSQVVTDLVILILQMWNLRYRVAQITSGRVSNWTQAVWHQIFCNMTRLYYLFPHPHCYLGHDRRAQPFYGK